MLLNLLYGLLICLTTHSSLIKIRAHTFSSDDQDVDSIELQTILKINSNRFEDQFHWKQVTVQDGNNYSYIDQSPKNGENKGIVLCLHGFPDLAIGWRYQIVDLVDRGYRVIAPDLLGYGRTSKPKEVKAYTKYNTCKALIDLLNHESIHQKIFVVAHDQGTGVASRFVQYFPERVKAWVTISVPPKVLVPPRFDQPIPDFPSIIRNYFPNFGYQLYFMSDRSSDQLSQSIQTFLLLIYYHTNWSPLGLNQTILNQLQPFNLGKPYVEEGVFEQQFPLAKVFLDSAQVESEEVKYFLNQYEKGGVTGPLNWYKSRPLDDQDAVDARLPQTYPSDKPYLFIGGTNDKALPLKLFDPDQTLRDHFPNGSIDYHIVVGGDHFMLQHPHFQSEVTQVLGDWIDHQQDHLL